MTLLLPVLAALPRGPHLLNLAVDAWGLRVGLLVGYTRGFLYRDNGKEHGSYYLGLSPGIQVYSPLSR